MDAGRIGERKGREDHREERDPREDKRTAEKADFGSASDSESAEEGEAPKEGEREREGQEGEDENRKHRPASERPPEPPKAPPPPRSKKRSSRPRQVFVAEPLCKSFIDESLKEPGPNTAKVHKDKKGPYLSGLFGVEKPNRFTKEGQPLLRVIMNLKPINRALKIIKGDIGELPPATSWTQLPKQSMFLRPTAFFLLRLPEAWRPFLCFNSRLDGSEIGRETDAVFVPTCIVMPMGWNSSVGLMQMASGELIQPHSRLGATELKK